MTSGTAFGAPLAGSSRHEDAWLIVAPHFEHPGHLGWVRTDRFRRWLLESGRRVSVVRAGSEDRTEDRPWGLCVTIRDPLGFYSDATPGRLVPPPPRKPNRVRTAVAHALFVPDPVAPWARRVERSAAVRRLISGAGWVLSSSPPESCHLAAARLARRLGAAHMVDFRDGWLDEPMIPLLAGSAVQRWRHRRVESRVVSGAEVILVTSDRWRELLVERYTGSEPRVVVVPNAYPEAFPYSAPGEVSRSARGVSLVYAGKIHSSRPERQVAQLMNPLLGGIVRRGGQGSIEFIGNLRHDEIRDLTSYKGRFEEQGWELSIRPPMPRSDLLRRVATADGLLMLATSMASLPAKIFEYLPSRRPILAVTPEGSEVEKLARSIPQLYVAVLHSGDGPRAVVDFLDAADGGCEDPVVPECFSETALRRRFERLVVG